MRKDGISDKVRDTLKDHYRSVLREPIPQAWRELLAKLN